MKGINLCGLAILLVTLTSWQYLDDDRETYIPPSGPNLETSTLPVQDGDLIFRRGRSLTSQAVLLADQESHFSHVGIVVKANTQQAMVVHAVPPTDKESGGVKADSIEDFLSERNAASWRVFRLTKNDGHQLSSAAAKYAIDAGKKKIDFDSAFDLIDDSKLYCTELVWRAYMAAGLDIVGGKFDKVQLPMLKTELAILPSRLENSHYFHPVLFPKERGVNE